MLNIIKRNLFLLLCMVFITNCVATRSYHGYLFEKEQTEIKGEVGKDDRMSILGTYGEPTLKSQIDDHVWYYIWERSSTKSFEKPEVNSRFITALKFDQNWMLQDIQNKSIDDSIKVSLVGDKTDTSGRKISLWDQMLGNIGQNPNSIFDNQNQ